MNAKWIAVAVSLGLMVGLSGADGQVISVSPLNPTTTDSVRVTVGSGFPKSGCWQLGEALCGHPAVDTLSATVPVGYCNGLPGCSCAQFPMTYEQVCVFAPLAAGTYVARFTEQHTSSYDPLATFTRTVGFTVSGTTPALRRSWAGLKIIYR